jgi:hypothetical protein
MRESRGVRDPCHKGRKRASAWPWTHFRPIFRDFLIARQQVKSNHMSDRSKSVEKVQRQRRLGAALRENLKRRKVQAKGRSAAESAGGVDKPHDSAGIVAKKS